MARALSATRFLVVLAVVALPALARASGLEGEVSLGIGVTTLGGRHPTGGLTLLPSGSIGWRFAEWGSLRYRNALPIFNLTAIRWIGVVNMNTALLGLHVGPLLLELGPSLDVFAVPLCASTGCQREHGVAPAGHLGAVLLPDPTSKFAAGVTVHITYIPGIAWSGVSANTALEGRYRWWWPSRISFSYALKALIHHERAECACNITTAESALGESAHMPAGEAPQEGP